MGAKTLPLPIYDISNNAQIETMTSWQSISFPWSHYNCTWAYLGSHHLESQM